jgi:hypothetical protein
VYYPNGMYHNENVLDQGWFDQDITGNYISSPNPKSWLFNNLSDFEEHCCKINAKPIGFIPWKMFEYTTIPVYKDKNYIVDRLDYIIKAHKAVSDIRNTTERSRQEQALNRMFPSRGSNVKFFSESKSKPKLEEPDETLDEIPEYDNMDEFFNL